MKICIVGAGATGGYLGVKLINAGLDVSLVARGAHLTAMKKKGLTLIENEKEIISNSVKKIINNLNEEEKRKILIVIPDNAKKHLKF